MEFDEEQSIIQKVILDLFVRHYGKLRRKSINEKLIGKKLDVSLTTHTIQTPKLMEYFFND